ncbi:MAG: glutamate--tRNA ligase, partial [Holosporaceae bacterium]|nr:glutamate--tRNA ligase [Holosporaceae bacterium]
MVTRFAPSPTGFLHIGGARTALFNWLLARHHGGKFLLRIEDTDRARSTPEAVDAIFKGLQWLGINWDEEPVFQFSRASRHVKLAEQLVESGNAYYCYCTPEELEAMREEAKSRGVSPKYNGIWRDRDPQDAPLDVRPVIRLKAPVDGKTTLNDIVQGTVTVDNAQLDDMVLVRSDGTPTFMLSVVVDDHEMGITHVIRGDDHLTNTFRQIQIYRAFGWDMPKFGHIPLIHGPDGAKLSKRHGALGIESYKDMGFLPEAICNCLLRLGWSHGDDEIISIPQAIEWFSTDNLGKSASRLDFSKLENLNGYYMREAPNERLLHCLLEIIGDVSEEKKLRLQKG